MPKHDGYKLDYSNIPAMKSDALEKAKRYFSALTYDNTKYDDSDDHFLDKEKDNGLQAENANIRDKNALKAYLLDLYNINNVNRLEAKNYRSADIEKQLKNIQTELNAINQSSSTKAKLTKEQKKLEQEKKAIEEYPHVGMSLVGVLEYLEKRNSNDLNLSDSSINDSILESLAQIKMDIVYLMEHSSAARYYLVLFKDQLDEELQNQIMLCELRRRAEAYRSKGNTEKKHKKHEHMVSLTSKLNKQLNPSTMTRLPEGAFDLNSSTILVNNIQKDNHNDNNSNDDADDNQNNLNQNFSQEAWDILNEGRFSHKTRDLLNFYKVKTMITLVEQDIPNMDVDQEQYTDNNNDGSSVASSRQSNNSYGSMAQRGPGRNNFRLSANLNNNDNVSIKSDGSEQSDYALLQATQEEDAEPTNNAFQTHSLPPELVEKYRKLSALASGYRALSRLSPLSLSNTSSVFSFLSSQLYRSTLARDTEEQKAEKKALKFCLDMIEGKTPDPLVPSANTSNDLTDNQKIELYQFFNCFHQKQYYQPYANAISILLNSTNQKHNFWEFHGHQLTLETPQDRNTRKGSNKEDCDTLEQRMVYLQYDKNSSKLKYSVISPEQKNIMNAELNKVSEETMSIYNGKSVCFETPPEDNLKDVLYVYRVEDKDNNNIYHLKYQYKATNSTSLSEGFCNFLSDKCNEKVLKHFAKPLSYEKEHALKNQIIDFARSAGNNFGLQNLGYSKSERKAAENEIFSLLAVKKAIYPHRFAEYKQVFDARQKREEQRNSYRAAYSQGIKG